MRFLCLGYHDEQAWTALPAAERDRLMADTMAFEQDLRRGGHVVDTKGLQNVRSAVTLRFAGGELAVTDGPFAETKEQIGGLMVLQADDMQHAVRLLSKLPCMRIGGSLEIRPLNEELSS
jgi:hypothetical protein